MESVELSAPFGNIYAGREVLVTGHTGFKGSWLCLWLTTLGARVSGLALAPETMPAHWSLLELRSVRDLRMDLRDGSAVRRAIEQVQPEIIFHLAAQPLVRRSYREPRETFETNVLGLVNLLESVRYVPSVRALVHATTDKVYLEQPTKNGYREEHPLGGHDPYSTSKACAELVTDCYRKSFFNSLGLRVATARAGNVIGGGDWSEDRLVPDLIRAVTSSSTLQIRNPQAVRPWQHVLDPLSGYLQLGQGLLSERNIEGAWNFGPWNDATLPVQSLVSRLQSYWPGLRIGNQTELQPHEAVSLQLDCTKAVEQLGWRPIWNAENTVERTARWYRAYYEDGRVLSREDLQEYVSAARKSNVAWVT